MVTYYNSICYSTLLLHEGFHCHGGIPIAGWFISWKIPDQNV